MAISLKSSNKKILVAAMAVLAALVGITLIYFQFDNLRALREEVNNEELALDQAIALLNQRLDHKRNAPVYEEKYEWLKILVPDNPEEEEILRYFAYLSEEFDLDISEIRFGGRVTGGEGGYNQMPLIINIEGRYRELVGMLDHLRQGNNRAIRIDNIDLTVLDANNGRLQIIFTANAFHRASEQ